MRLSGGRGEMTLSLTPEHLGALRLTITSDAHGVAARIVVQTAQAHHAVEGAKEQLRSALENRGLTLNSLDVTLNNSGADGSGAFARQQENAQTMAEFANRRTLNRPLETAPAAPPPPSIHAARRDAMGRLDYSA